MTGSSLLRWGLIGTLVCERPYRIPFAGRWYVWKHPDGNRIPSCAIITTVANDLLVPIHNQMPVILTRELRGF